MSVGDTALLVSEPHIAKLAVLHDATIVLEVCPHDGVATLALAVGKTQNIGKRAKNSALQLKGRLIKLVVVVLPGATGKLVFATSPQGFLDTVGNDAVQFAQGNVEQLLPEVVPGLGHFTDVVGDDLVV